MKRITTLSAVVCALAMLGLANLARADEEKKPCCEATVEAGKKCEHECCKKAAADGKVCEKCHPKKEEGKDEKKG